MRYFYGFVFSWLTVAITPCLHAQSQVYDNFEGSSSVHYISKTGSIDTTAKNPSVNGIDSSLHCARYTRNGEKKFDNIKMSFNGKLTGVDKYATYEGQPPRIRMKIYTTAPIGTLVEILLGNRKGNNDYPAGTNSQYQAHTTKSGEWEEIEFIFSQVPKGSETPFTSVDQLTLLFDPNSSTVNTYYFDDITGPVVNYDHPQTVDAPH
jgi:hypothetical protein